MSTNWTDLYDRPLTYHGYSVTFFAPFAAKVNNGDGRQFTVTDWDCEACSYERPDTGAAFCNHQDAMFAAMIHADDERMRDYHEENADRYAVMAGAA